MAEQRETGVQRRDFPFADAMPCATIDLNHVEFNDIVVDDKEIAINLPSTHG